MGTDFPFSVTFVVVVKFGLRTWNTCARVEGIRRDATP
eukprot:COSAG02_NODE_44612_length_364_cov_1.426415_1_plen_37_part_10